VVQFAENCLLITIERAFCLVTMVLALFQLLCELHEAAQVATNYCHACSTHAHLQMAIQVHVNLACYSRAVPAGVVQKS
jgi:hypothetical protein